MYLVTPSYKSKLRHTNFNAIIGPGVVTHLCMIHEVSQEAENKNDEELTTLDEQMKKLSWLEDFSVLDIASARNLDDNIGPVKQWYRDGIRPGRETLSGHSAETKALVAR